MRAIEREWHMMGLQYGCRDAGDGRAAVVVYWTQVLLNPRIRDSQDRLFREILVGDTVPDMRRVTRQLQLFACLFGHLGSAKQ